MRRSKYSKITFVTKQATSIRRSTVLSLPAKLVFPGLGFTSTDISVFVLRPIIKIFLRTNLYKTDCQTKYEIAIKCDNDRFII
jgi:hypothetical protein